MIHINYLLTQRIENAQNGLRRVINPLTNADGRHRAHVYNKVYANTANSPPELSLHQMCDGFYQ